MDKLQKTEWQIEHKEVMDSFLQELYSHTDEFILKGGTALQECYGLDRFSEDIDLDRRKEQGDFIKHVEDFCEKNGYSFRVAKDTDTTKRVFINYGDNSRPLKVELSQRRLNIPETEIQKINGITTYSIDRLCSMKASAYNGRDRIRDLYDLTFICNQYKDSLSENTLSSVKDVLEYKGIEQFDYLLEQEKDELIDSDKLASDFLLMYENLGLLYNEEERIIMNEITTSIVGEDSLVHTDQGFMKNEEFADRIIDGSSGDFELVKNSREEFLEDRDIDDFEL